LDLLLDPLAQSFTEGQAAQILDWKLQPEQEERLAYLRHGANEGNLTTDETEEYQRLIEDLDLIAIIRIKTLQSLSKTAA
jgi:hypothetical protein